jgi:hypothetical protein
MYVSGAGNADGIYIASDGTGDDIELAGDGRINGSIDVATALSGAERVAIVDSTWDRILTGATHNIPASAGRRLRQLEAAVVLTSGTAQRGGDSSMVLASVTSEADNYFNDNILVVIAGTGAGQARSIRDYTGSTDSVSLDVHDVWNTIPDNTSEYEIIVGWPTHVTHLHGTSLNDIAQTLLGYKDTAWVADSPGDKIRNTPVNVWAADTGGVALTKYGGAVLDHNDYKADVTNVTVGAVGADAIGAPAFDDDAQFMVYGGGVWVDDGANENTVPGVDGLPSNPVGTIAAAKTIADAIGSNTIYFLAGTNETIGATMEHYRFIGMSAFGDVTLAFCALLGNVSLKSGTDSYFHLCYSGVAGNLTPTLTFGGSGAATENLNVRAYSGGLHVLTMTAGDVMSFEVIGGQLQIGADCNASATVTARGMMTLNDSAGVNLTYAATAQYQVDLSQDINYFWGACDSCYQILFPEDGSSNKDSAYVINPKEAGADTLVGRVLYHHSNVPSVYDSAYFYRAPWW